MIFFFLGHSGQNRKRIIRIRLRIFIYEPYKMMSFYYIGLGGSIMLVFNPKLRIEPIFWFFKNLKKSKPMNLKNHGFSSLWFDLGGFFFSAYEHP